MSRWRQEGNIVRKVISGKNKCIFFLLIAAKKKLLKYRAIKVLCRRIKLKVGVLEIQMLRSTWSIVI